MKKQKWVVWTLLLVLCAALTVPVFAAAPLLTFALDIDGAKLSEEQYNIYSASPGDTLTVRFSILRTDSAEPFTLFAIQNEIEFDMNFFTFVENSIVKHYTNADADLQTRVWGQEIVKASALGGPQYAAEQAFCEFQLKIKNGASGSGWIRCSNAAAIGSDHASLTVTERNLAVSVGGAPAVLPTSTPTPTPTPVRTSGGSGSNSGSGRSGGGSTAAPTLTPAPTPVPTTTPGASVTPATVTPTLSVTPAPSPLTAPADCPKDHSCPIAAFSDLNPSAWYHDGVHFCVEQGIMNGYSDGTFGPQKIVTRAQLAMILWNRAGRPETHTTLTFNDVDPNGWYAGAIRWALREKLLTGYSADLFGPNDILTRQQLAAILYRYSGSPALANAALSSTTQSDPLAAFGDRDQIASYAREALAWAVNAGLIQGTTPVTLNPRGSATRAQSAVIIMRYLTGAGKESV